MCKRKIQAAVLDLCLRENRSPTFLNGKTLMNDETKIIAILEKMEFRKNYDEIWARRDFALSQIFVWMTILSSFLSTALASINELPLIASGFIASIPALSILIEKNFSFSTRAKWHWEMVVHVDQLIQQLRFEGTSVEEISKRFSALRIEMEDKFPAMRLLNEKDFTQ